MLNHIFLITAIISMGQQEGQLSLVNLLIFVKAKAGNITGLFCTVSISSTALACAIRMDCVRLMWGSMTDWLFSGLGHSNDPKGSEIEELAEGIYEVRAKLQKQICQNIILRKKTSLFSKHPGSWQIVRGWLVISKKQLLDFFFFFWWVIVFVTVISFIRIFGLF